MMRLLGFATLAFGVAACASTGPGASSSRGGTPLIMDRSIAQEVRTAGSCYAFNRDADRYLFGVQAEAEDYPEAAEFWRVQLEQVEPSANMRQRLMDSARTRMDQDFPRREAPASGENAQVEVFNIGYGTMIQVCKDERAKLEADNG